ncbi:MAG: NnrU family protein, partial [Sphingomonadaceae bacterium]
HPMMWSFILWAAVHAMLWGSAANLIVAAGIGILAFVGAYAQDAKKRALLGAEWREWQAKTAFWPFAAQLAGKAAWRDIVPGAIVWIGGIALWLVATGAHGWLGAPVAGPWRWFG